MSIHGKSEASQHLHTLTHLGAFEGDSDNISSCQIYILELILNYTCIQIYVPPSLCT